MRVLDTFALMEIIDNNQKFLYLLDEEFVITEPTLAEFWAVIYRANGEEVANYWLKKFSPFSEKIDLFILKEAYKLRIDTKKNLSLIDCIGYTYAIMNKFKFVTGDKSFKNIKGVEFIS